MGATTFSRLFRRLSVLVPCAVIGATAAVMVPAGAAPSVDLDQCRNGAASTPSDCDATAWDNGNLNAQQAHYVEGQSAPYRLVMEELPLNIPITVVLGYDIKHSGKHAIDFLTHYDRLEPHGGHAAEDVLPLDGVTGVSGTVGTFPIPAPSSVGSPVAGQPTTAFNALPAGERLMTLFGGTVSAMAYVLQGNLSDAGNEESHISVTFTADSATAVLAWGGHIATSADWGAGNSASGVSGSPYHMSVESWTLGNLGNQDRSMSAGVVAAVPAPPAPAQLTVTKIVINNDGGTAVVSDFPLFVGTTSVTSGVAGSFAAGTYTVSETNQLGYTATIGGDCAADGSITLVAGQPSACTITNDDVAVLPLPALLTVTKIVVNDDGGTGVVGDFDLLVDGTEVTSGSANVLQAGSYTVSEGAHAGYVSTIGGACAANGSITLAAGQSAACTITNNDVASTPPVTPTVTDPPVTPTVTDPPVTNPAATDVESQNAAVTPQNPPLQAAPVPTPVVPTPVTPVLSGQELPRTGAGLREETFLALALMLAGLSAQALGRRRSVQADV